MRHDYRLFLHSIEKRVAENGARKQEKQLGKSLAVYPALFSCNVERSLKAWHDTVRRAPARGRNCQHIVEGEGREDDKFLVCRSAFPFFVLHLSEEIYPGSKMEEEEGSSFSHVANMQDYSINITSTGRQSDNKSMMHGRMRRDQWKPRKLERTTDWTGRE